MKALYSTLIIKKNPFPRHRGCERRGGGYILNDKMILFTLQQYMSDPMVLDLLKNS